ncbi:MAG: dTDP-4-dehydrorhamnose 3,5-epimerase family protein, partial [Natronohydrobacter sp.]|nr:dTDP-4-dehydrorhamnose 3,5-epimerase family protein [Natronohydrobacter sp.]
MQVISLNILDLVLVTPGRFSDARGWFSETWNKAALAKAGLEWPEFIQDNHSYSAPRHTLRGLHF